MHESLSSALTVFELAVKALWRHKQQKSQCAGAIIYGAVLWQGVCYTVRGESKNHPAMLYCSVFGCLDSACRSSSIFCQNVAHAFRVWYSTQESSLYSVNCCHIIKKIWPWDINRYLHGPRSHYPLLNTSYSWVYNPSQQFYILWKILLLWTD